MGPLTSRTGPLPESASRTGITATVLGIRAESTGSHLPERLCSEPVFPAILPIQLRLLTGLFQARSPSTLPPPGFLLACTLSRSHPQYSATKSGIIRYRKWYRAQS